MKTFKRICMTLIIMMLTMTLTVGTLSFSAFALNVGSNDEYLSKVTVASKVKYGETFGVPASAGTGTTVKVTAPNGKVVKEEAGEVLAEQVGIYTVSYSQKDSAGKEYSYDFDVKSYVDEDYTINVLYGGATIPTVTTTGSEIVFPSAELGYYDDDNVWHKDDAVVKVKTSLNDTEYTANGTDKIKLENFAGKLYVTYYAKFKGYTKVYTQDFEVTVQDASGFKDEERPTLNTVNVAENASLNRKFTLPTATATDNWDKNVQVTVKVTFGDEEVPQVEVDEDDYVKLDENGKPVVKTEKEVFDNNKKMSFYPTQVGRYTVTYQAHDDAGNHSTPHDYTINVSDTTAPVFKEINDYSIPEKWGVRVKKEGVETDAGISFPMPAVIDNNGAKNVTVSFKITDNTDNANKTVISFDNIFNEDEEFTGSDSTYGTAGQKYKFKDLKFLFSEVHTHDNGVGDYTVEYTARDAKPNRSYKTYKINVVEEYEDTAGVDSIEAKIEDAPEYLVAADGETFTVPARVASKRDDTRPQIEYTLASEADADVTLDVVGGEVLDIVEDAGKFYLVNDINEKLLIEGDKKITLNLSVTDKLGYNKTDSAEVKVFSSASSNTSFDMPQASFDIKTANADGSSFKTNALANLGSFKIDVGNDDFRPYTGYELSVKNTDDGKYVSEVESEFFYNVADKQIVVRNIKFKPSQAGNYQVCVRAFDLTGKNIVRVALVQVEKGSDGGTTTTAATIPSKGNINATYSFRCPQLNIPGGEGNTYHMAYKIKGSRYAVMGKEFTAKTATSYEIIEGYVQVNGSTVLDDEVKTDVSGSVAYTVSFTDSNAPVIEIQDVMPTYKAKGEVVTLPSIVAYNANGMGEIELKVRYSSKLGGSGSGGSIDTTYDKDTNRYSFTAKNDGEYRVIVSGTVNGESVSMEKVIYVGDVKGPAFSVSYTDAFQANRQQGAEFKFGKIVIDTASLDEGENQSDFRYVKTLYDPSNEVVSEATIDGTGTRYRDLEQKDSNTKITLTKSGTYEIKYEVYDKLGNVTTFREKITVSGKTAKSPFSIAAISTVLIVVGVVLIAAVILYFVLFRKRRIKQEKTGK